MDSEKQPTMQQIADRVGCSRMAVSLALRNSPKISKKTTERIHEIAEEVGYRPNPMVSALMTQLRHGREVKRPTTLAYVTSSPTEGGWREPGPFVEFFDGATARAAALGYKLEEWWLRRPGLSEHRFCHILFTRNIQGLLIAPLPPGGGELALDWRHFAMATIGYSVTSPNIHRASNDQYRTIRLALAELTKRGYQRIGMAMTAENDERVQHNWSAGMLVYQSLIPEAQRVPSLLAREPFGRAFGAWYREHRPDAVVGHTLQCLGVFAELGVRVPEEVGFAHLALTAGDPWAGVNQNARLVGAAAIDLVDAQLRRNERDIPAQQKTVLIPGYWVPGPTVREVSVPAVATQG